eukprot:6184218-Pleurochrysis_carterae.AAC.2
MSWNMSCYKRDTCDTRWHLVAIFGAFGRSFALAGAKTRYKVHALKRCCDLAHLYPSEDPSSYIGRKWHVNAYEH